MAIIPKPFRSYKLGPPRGDARTAGAGAVARGGSWRRWKKRRRCGCGKAADILPAVLKDLRIDRRRAEAEVLKVWNNLIDPDAGCPCPADGVAQGHVVRDGGQQPVVE